MLNAMADFPIVQSYKNIEKLFDAMQRAEIPARFSYETLKKLGLTSSTDRGLISLLKKLSFLGPNGEPLEAYREMKGARGWRPVLGRQIRQAYRDLYAIDPEMHVRDRKEVSGAMARLTGKSQTTVDNMAWLYLALAKQAQFEGEPQPIPEAAPDLTAGGAPNPTNQTLSAGVGIGGFYYNIQIHLPAVRDIGVYNAIFKSIREHLLQQ